MQQVTCHAGSHGNAVHRTTLDDQIRHACMDCKTFRCGLIWALSILIARGCRRTSLTSRCCPSVVAHSGSASLRRPKSVAEGTMERNPCSTGSNTLAGDAILARTPPSPGPAVKRLGIREFLGVGAHAPVAGSDAGTTIQRLHGADRPLTTPSNPAASSCIV